MEISERELRLLTADADDHHRDGLATMAADVRELHAATRTLRSTRREMLARAVAAAGTVAVGSATLPLAGLLPAAAQEGEEETFDDPTLAAFAESVELVAVEAYTQAAQTGFLSSALTLAGQTFADHHRQHAAAFASIAGSKAKGKANERLMRAVADQLRNAQDQSGLLRVALDIENAAAATYLFALGVLESEAAQRLAASILPVESQHAVVIGQALGIPLDSAVPTFENQDRAVDPTIFAIDPTTTTTTSTTTK
ncbi:MAG TPA: ferritin-like domain-containing protein [Acidimicrobiales bacterium]